MSPLATWLMVLGLCIAFALLIVVLPAAHAAHDDYPPMPTMDERHQAQVERLRCPCEWHGDSSNESTPLYDAVLDDLDWRAWQQEVGDIA